MTEITKKYKKIANLTKVVSILMIFIPLIVYVIIAFINGSVGEKFTMGCMVICALILTVINILFKYNMRSTIWLIFIGIYSCLDSIMPLIWILAISTILDEFILSPLHKKYKQKYIINKEIDARG